MEINRNQWMMIGLVILSLGIQFRMVDSFVLNEKSTEIIAKRLHKNDTAATTFMPAFNVPTPCGLSVLNRM